MQVVMTKNKIWRYASGAKMTPVVSPNNTEETAALVLWKEEDKKTKADLYLRI